MEQIAVRSEQRIKQRKQRRYRIAAVCIPVALCVGAVWLLLPGSSKNPGPADAVTGLSGESTVQVSTQKGLEEQLYSNQVTVPTVQVLQEDTQQVCATLTDPEQIRQVLEILQGGTTLAEDNGLKEQTVYGDGGKPVYTLTVTLETETRVYTWKENTLTCQNTGQTRHLTAQELYTLKNLLKGG